MEELVLNIIESLKAILNSSSFIKDKIQEVSRIYSEINELFNNDIFTAGNCITGKLVLNDILKYIKKIEKITSKTSQKISNHYRKKLKVNISKVKFLIQYIETSLATPDDDLACLSCDHERKLALKNITTTVYLENEEKVKEQVKNFYNKRDLMKVVIYKAQKFNNSKSRNLMTGWFMLYYAIFAKKKISVLSMLCDAEVNTEILCMYWRGLDSKLYRKISSVLLSSIKVNTIIFIPRLANNVLDPTSFEMKTEGSLHYIETLSQEPILAGVDYTLTQDPGKNRVPIRILSSIPIHKLQGSSTCTCYPSSVHENHKFEKIIIHIHGGGFLALSSFSHQIYTRVWANDLNIPIFSIDYRLSPEHKFPAGLDDIWQAYTWIVKYAHKCIGISPKKIILVGDSAGGNLIAALTLKAISVGFRVPDGLCMVYPSTNLQKKYFSIGTLLAVEDKILSYNYGKVMITCYVDENSFSIENYLISPLFASQELLEKFPKTEIMITLNDPLAHDTFRFAEKLLNANVNVHITEYPGVCHGALNFGNKTGIPAYKKFVDDARIILEKLLV